MTHEEELRDTATQLDELLELKSRTHCLDELCSIAMERLHYYHEKNVGSTMDVGKINSGYPPYNQHSFWFLGRIVWLPLNPRLRERLTNQLQNPIS